MFLILAGAVTFLMRSFLHMAIISCFCAAAGLILLFIKFLKRCASERIYHLFAVFISVIAALFVISFSATEFFVISGAIKAYSTDPGDYTDVEYIILPGAGINGENPSLLYRKRLDLVRYLMQGNDKTVIICGGQGNDEIISEAEAGKKYLISNGISESRIVTETESTDTSENFANAKKLLPSLDRAILVTNDFHIYRCCLIAKRCGIDPIPFSAETPQFHLKLNYFSREYVSLMVYFLENAGININTANFHI